MQMNHKHGTFLELPMNLGEMNMRIGQKHHQNKNGYGPATPNTSGNQQSASGENVADHQIPGRNQSQLVQRAPRAVAGDQHHQRHGPADPAVPSYESPTERKHPSSDSPGTKRKTTGHLRTPNRTTHIGPEAGDQSHP